MLECPTGGLFSVLFHYSFPHLRQIKLPPHLPRKAECIYVQKSGVSHVSAGGSYCLMLSNAAFCTLLSSDSAGKVSASISRYPRENFIKGCHSLGSHFSSAVEVILTWWPCTVSGQSGWKLCSFSVSSLSCSLIWLLWRSSSPCADHWSPILTLESTDKAGFLLAEREFSFGQGKRYEHLAHL